MILKTIGIGSTITALFLVYRYLTSSKPQPTHIQSTDDDLPPPLPSVILPSLTTHRRLLPVESSVGFSYPLVYLGVDLDSLQSGQLNIPRFFEYGSPPYRSLLTLRHASYLSEPKLPGCPTTFKGELLDLLSCHGVNTDSVGRVWLVTMPSYFGKTGINPLSVYFVYDKVVKGKNPSEGATSISEDEDWVKEDFDKLQKNAAPSHNTPSLLAVVLEVHNTFEERHTYVLQTGINESPIPATDTTHSHAWIFPRSFHVSPFNSRSGYYRLLLRDPFSANNSPTKVEFNVSLYQLTQNKDKKYQAFLFHHPSRASSPVTTANILSKIVWNQPWDLFLTSPRIMKQAWILHFQKRLVVYPRPELDDGMNREVLGFEAAGDVDAVKPFNPTEEEGSPVGRSIGWKKTSWIEKKAETVVVDWLSQKLALDDDHVKIEIRFANIGRRKIALGRSNSKKVLQIYTRHPAFFTQLICLPSIKHFLLNAAADGHTYISDDDLFGKVFSHCTACVDAHSKVQGLSHLATQWNNSTEGKWFAVVTAAIYETLYKCIDGLRYRYHHFLASFSKLLIPPSFIIWTYQPTHFLYQSIPLVNVSVTLVIIFATYLDAVMEEQVMHSLGARFVEGQAPWEGFARSMSWIWNVDGKGAEGLGFVDRKKKELCPTLGSIRD